MMTATEVGGDYYDVLPIEDGCWIAVGDASGHGLTSGLVMMMVQTGVATLVRAEARRQARSDVLKTLNRVLFENVHDRLEAERHMTLSLLRYRPRRHADRRRRPHGCRGVARRDARRRELLADQGHVPRDHRRHRPRERRAANGQLARRGPAGPAYRRCYRSGGRGGQRRSATRAS